MNLLVNNHLILLDLRSFSAMSHIWPSILFYESMVLTVTENVPIISLERFFMKVAFHWRSCTMFLRAKGADSTQT